MGVYGSPDLSQKEMKKPKKPIYKRWWFWLIIIIVIIAIGSDGEEDKPKLSGDQSSAVDNQAKEPEATPETPEFFGVGETVETSKVKATITEMAKAEGSEFNKPEDGKEFVLLKITIENMSDEELNISSILSFNSYVDDVALGESLNAQLEADSTMDGTIAAGKKLNGTLGYEVPTDWEVIEVHFEPDVWDDVKIQWIVENK